MESLAHCSNRFIEGYGTASDSTAAQAQKTEDQTDTELAVVTYEEANYWRLRQEIDLNSRTF